MTADISDKLYHADRSGSDYDRALARARVKEHQRPHWRRWVNAYLSYCEERNVDPVDEHNEAPFVEHLGAEGTVPWQCDQARAAVGLYYELVGGYRPRGGTRGDSAPRRRTGRRGKLDEVWVRALETMTTKIATKHLSDSTRGTYTRWVHRFAHANHDRDPHTLTAIDAHLFLEKLAIEGNVSASTQNLAFSSLLFFYRKVLGVPFEGLEDTLDSMERGFRKFDEDFELGILAHIARNHFAHLMLLQHQPDAEIVYAGIVRDAGQVFYPGRHEGGPHLPTRDVHAEDGAVAAAGCR